MQVTVPWVGLVRSGVLLGLLVVSMSAYAQDCEKSSILSPSPFMGNNGEIFKLADQSLWEVKYEYEYLYEYYPTVTICPAQGKLIIGKKSLNVQRVTAAKAKEQQASGASGQVGRWTLFEETSLQGSISGTVKPGRVFKTTSGSVYEVTGLTLQLVLELQPSVLVLRDGDTYKLIVTGFEEPLICRKLNSSSVLGGAVAQQQSAPPIPSYFESRTEGEFSGWEGETIVKLANGQIWIQTEYFYRYRYAYRPKVIVYLTDGVYKMQVDGIDKAVGVKLLR